MSRRPGDDDDAEYARAPRNRQESPDPNDARPVEPGKLSSTQLLSLSPSAAWPMAMSPGKVSLTGLLPVQSRATPAQSGSGTTPPSWRFAGATDAGAIPHRPPPIRIADATQGQLQLNAVLKVVVIDASGKVIQRWQSRARWSGPLPVRWAAARAGNRWKWDHSDAQSLKVQTDARGRGGMSIEAWAQPAAARVVVHVQALDAVTIDADADADTQTPGHAKRQQDAGDGATTRIQPGGKGPTTDGDAQHRGDPQPGAEEPRASDLREKLIADFERELDLYLQGDPRDGEDIPDLAGGEHDRGKGEAGGQPDGRTGDDTQIGGTGPGGEQAKPDGKGQGSANGRGAGGSEGGSRDGKKGGDEDGMYGGEGAPGDRGVPSAIALFGGLFSVPVALRGFVELALLLSAGDVTGAGKQLFKQGLGKLATTAITRKMLAHEARVVAVHETKAVIQRISTDKRTAKTWAKATAEERRQAMRIVYWELQRTYFKGYLEAAKQAKAQAKAVLRKTPKSASAQQSLATAEMAEELATVSPVAGRLPQNHKLAGKQFPSDRLPAAYRKQGVRFTDTGFPDFEPHAVTLPNGKKYVKIDYTGSHYDDFAAADAKAGYATTPKGYTWHHSEELGRMYLIPLKLHRAVKHTGGVATYKHVTGDVRSYAK